MVVKVCGCGVKFCLYSYFKVLDCIVVVLICILTFTRGHYCIPELYLSSKQGAHKASLLCPIKKKHQHKRVRIKSLVLRLQSSQIHRRRKKRACGNCVLLATTSIKWHQT